MKNRLPEGWKEVTLAEVAEVFNGKTPSELEKRKEGYPILKIKDITEDGCFKGSFDSFVDSDFFNKYNNKTIKIGDTLILNAAHNAEYVGSKTFYVKEFPGGVISTGEWLTIRSKPSFLDTKFKHFLMTSPSIKTKIKDKVKGIHLYPKDVRDIKIPLPPFPTQQKIVSILEKAEQAKEWRKEADELTKEFLKSVFVEMFGDPKDNIKKWTKGTLENNCIRICVSYVGPCDKYYTTPDKGVPMIRTGNLKENYLDITDLKYVTKEFHGKNIKSQLHFGDLLIARHGTNGQAALVAENLKDANCLNVVIIRTNIEKYNPTFLQWLFNSASTLHQISGKTGGSTQSVINTHAIQKLILIVPPLPLQQKFASIVQEVEAMKEQQKHSKEHLYNLFNVLMQKAFRGELAS